MPEQERLAIDPGLPVVFNGKKYRLLTSFEEDCCDKEYPIGGLIAELMRLGPSDLKTAIMEIRDDLLSVAPTEEAVADVMYQLHRILWKKFPPIIAIIVSTDFSNLLSEWLGLIRAGNPDPFSVVVNGDTKEGYKSIQEFIFEGSNFTGEGVTSVLQMMLSAYLYFSYSFVSLKRLFMEIVSETEELSTDHTDAFLSMYSSNISFQHIDYRTINIEGEFMDLFMIKSSMSLFLFEMAHCISQKTKFVRCPICNQYFVPFGRSDTKYCSYPSAKYDGKPCWAVGAQVTRANKEHSDMATRAYRRTYMRLQMKSRRHPGDMAARTLFETFSDAGRTWRSKLTSGAATTDEFLVWLSQYGV